MSDNNDLFRGIEALFLSSESMGCAFAAEVAQVSRSDPRRAAWFLEQGVPLNEKHGGWPALTWAIIRDHRDVFDDLIDIARKNPGILDFDSPDEFGWTPMMRAAHLGKSACVRALAGLGAGRTEEAKALAVAQKHFYLADVIDAEVDRLAAQARAAAEDRAAGVVAGKVIVLRDAFAPRPANLDSSAPQAPILLFRPRR